MNEQKEKLRRPIGFCIVAFSLITFISLVFGFILNDIKIMAMGGGFLSATIYTQILFLVYLR